MTKESLNSVSIRRYIDITAESAYGKVSGIFDALTLTNKDKYIFVFIVSDEKTSEQLVSDLKTDPKCSISVTEQADVFELVRIA